MNEGAFDWAIVEMMGHRRRAGLVSEVERFGAKLLRIDIPVPDGGFVTEFYGGSAIYALRPCSEAIAREVAHGIGDPRPVSPLRLRAAPAEEPKSPPGEANYIKIPGDEE